ncbi:3514_t:CDS:2 [Ambispora leptoticha]|uniref:3514_t:CDS:1 n=1 Tax=Ambispora leptoticha TaxID=144679 RepID=A0A9N9F218_9GLOM|nr:3514_t:CDS:2 [Ambispora leptoticha]
MDQDLAKALFDKGAFLLFLNAPPGLEFGIDYNSWQIGPKFLGVKLIPPGLHFVYYSVTDTSTAASGIRSGFFRYYEKKEGCVVIKEWDKIKEDLKEDSELDQEQNERIKSDMRQLDQYLGAYPLNTYQKWHNLTDHVTPSLVSRILPDQGRLNNISSSTVDEEELQDIRGKEKGNKQQYQQEESVNDTIMFTKFDLKRSWRPGAFGPEVTKYSQDKSWLLSELLSKIYRDDYKELLGELQLAFVCLLLGQNYAGFVQWKNLIHLLCGCREVLLTYADNLFVEFLDILRHQLEECSDDFFRDVISENNFLAHMLKTFRRNLLDLSSTNRSPELGTLKRKFEKIRTFLNRKFKWEMIDSAVRIEVGADDEEEEGEYAPIIIDVSDQSQQESPLAGDSAVSS